MCAAQKRARETGSQQSVELVALTDLSNAGEQCHLKVIVQCIQSETQEFAGFLCSCIDISQEKSREQTLKHLLREVAHRSKNMLAMVLSISAQTARSASTIEGFVRAFTGRIQSMAKSQNVITDSDWTGARFRELVEQQVLNVVVLDGSKISVSGDNPLLTPNVALHVGLALHELVTNALIHGALSLGDSQIDIDCQVTQAKGMTPEAVITWRESPLGSKLSEARDHKFGKTMLERIVPAAVNGTGSLTISEDGVYYQLTIDSTGFR